MQQFISKTLIFKKAIKKSVEVLKKYNIKYMFLDFVVSNEAN